MFRRIVAAVCLKVRGVTFPASGSSPARRTAIAKPVLTGRHCPAVPLDKVPVRCAVQQFATILVHEIYAGLRYSTPVQRSTKAGGGRRAPYTHTESHQVSEHIGVPQVG
jgi:hypothetical protein